MSMQSKKEGHGKLYRTLTYIFLIFLAISDDSRKTFAR